MRIHLASIETSLYPDNYSVIRDAYTLTSFYYARNGSTAERLIKTSKQPVILDSGAFSFLGKKAINSKGIDWEVYADAYAEFVDANNIKLYMELDIDNIVGYSRVKELTRRIEKKTNKQCIPVWHKARGVKEYLRLCDEYNYIAIGGIVSGEIKQNQYNGFIQLISEAHKRNCKVHGLGFTYITQLPKYHFDSVDSTSWTFGRYGHHWVFNGRTISMIRKPPGVRCRKMSELQRCNLLEWIKYSDYAERNL